MKPKRGNKYVDVGNGMNKGTIVEVTNIEEIDLFDGAELIHTKILIYFVVKRLGMNKNLRMNFNYKMNKDIFNRQFKSLNKKIKRIK